MKAQRLVEKATENLGQRLLKAIEPEHNITEKEWVCALNSEPDSAPKQLPEDLTQPVSNKKVGFV